VIQSEGVMGLLDPYYRAIRGVPSQLSSPLGMSDMVAEMAMSGGGGGSYDANGNRWEQLAARRAQNRYGWGPQDFRYIDWIIGGGGPNDVVAESRWNPNAVNPSSGAYGIPQILPQAHPESLGLNPSQQVNWLLRYIQQRYGTPQAAYAFKSDKGWY